MNPQTNPATAEKQLPPGKYAAIPTHVELKSTQKGTNFVEVRFAIIDGPHAHRALENSFWLTAKTWERTAEVLKALGAETSGEAVVLKTIKEKCRNRVTLDLKKYEQETDAQGTPRVSRDGQPIMRPVFFVQRAGFGSVVDAKQFANSLSDAGIQGFVFDAPTSPTAPTSATSTAAAEPPSPDNSDDDLPF
jgi:hypothetical protein